jgi:hypothetical protein
MFSCSQILSIYAFPLMWETKFQITQNNKDNSVLYTLIVSCLDTRQKVEDSDLNGNKHTSNLIFS